MLADKGGNKGWELVDKLKGNGAGRGQSVPSPPVMMHLDHQGPAVTYSEAASRLPQRTVVSSPELAECDMRLKMAACKKEKEAAWATLEWIQRQEQEEEATWKKREEHELCRIW